MPEQSLLDVRDRALEALAGAKQFLDKTEAVWKEEKKHLKAQKQSLKITLIVMWCVVGFNVAMGIVYAIKSC